MVTEMLSFIRFPKGLSLTTLFIFYAFATISMTTIANGSVKGAKVFKKCVACHSLKPGKAKLGPSLHGLYGRTAGRFVDSKGRKFKHSQNMKAAGTAGLVWTAETLRAYIGKPKPYISSILGKKRATTKMAFKGLKKQTDIDALLEYLEPFAKGAKLKKK